MRRPSPRFAPAPSAWPSSTPLQSPQYGVSSVTPQACASSPMRQRASGFRTSWQGSSRTATVLTHAADAGAGRQRRHGALAALHRLPSGLAHGAVTPAHIVLAARRFGRPDRQRVRRGARVARMEPREAVARVPRRAAGAASLPRFDQRADVTQLGAVVLAIALRRRLRDDEYPRCAADLVHCRHAGRSRLPARPRFACGSSRRCSFTRVRCSRPRSRRERAFRRDHSRRPPGPRARHKAHGSKDNAPRATVALSRESRILQHDDRCVSQGPIPRA